MSTIIIILVILLACSVMAGTCFWYAMRYHPPLEKPLPFISPPWRKLTKEERDAAELYIESLRKAEHTIVSGSTLRVPERLALTSQSNKVYPVTRAITRYGLSSDEPQKWRYYLDEMEVHLPPLWEKYIAGENYVELIKAQPVPLVISLNGHSLVNYVSEQAALPPLPNPQVVNASIRKEETENVELLKVRKETAEEYRLSRPDGIRETMMINAALLMLFFSLLCPTKLMLWLVFIALALILLSVWLFFHSPGEKYRRDIHCLRGTPKRWGLFSEAYQGQINNVSLGIIDLIYPAHWQNYISHDLGKLTDIDIYLNHQVVRQGPFLSLQEEVRRFPLQRWNKHAILALGSLLILALLISWVPLKMPLKISLAWLQGNHHVQADNVDQLQKMNLQPGDYLTVKNHGMCSVSTDKQNHRNPTFLPFDCSAIYWNNGAPLAPLHSTIVDKAVALRLLARQQLHRQDNDTTEPQAVLAKSNMILLDNFAGLVQKTQDLCSQPQECVRLKNALVNLSNVKNWKQLIQKAQSGALNNMNVLLRPVSALTLEKLVESATSSFFLRESQRLIDALNSLPPGGFLIISDEGYQFVNQPQPTVPLFNYEGPQQWAELQRLSAMLMHTPFVANGLITDIYVDANGTRHITLHNTPNMLTLSRYLGTSLLLCFLVVNLLVNTFIALRRIKRSRQRIIDIQRYYDRCFNTPKHR